MPIAALPTTGNGKPKCVRYTALDRTVARGAILRNVRPGYTRVLILSHTNK